MSSLVVFREESDHPELSTSDPARAARELGEAGVRFERWEATVVLAPGASSEEVIAAYRADIDRVCRTGGYVTVDVVGMRPDHPDREAIRRKFLAEHTHSEDEVRFFVEGAGLFCFHIADRVYQLRAEAGDLVFVPAGARHWFDTGPAPRFTAIRLFINPAGWVAHYTGSDIATRFPTFDA